MCFLCIITSEVKKKKAYSFLRAESSEDQKTKLQREMNSQLHNGPSMKFPRNQFKYNDAVSFAVEGN